MLRLILQWVLSALSLTIIARVLPGFHVNSFGTAIIVAGVYGILQVLLASILKIIFFIPYFLTFGLFALVINAFLLFLTDKLVASFRIDGLWPTFLGAVLLTILNGLWAWLFFS
jgi:putative membrane protein